MSMMKTSNQGYGSHYRTQSTKKEHIGTSTLEYLKRHDTKNFLQQQQNIAQKQRHGLFTQPIPLGPGDLYRDPAIYKPQKGVGVNQRMQQKVGPELFSKMPSTDINDIYKDKFRENQLYLKQKTDMSIHPTSFNAGGKQKLVKHSEFEHQKQFNDKQYNTRNQDGTVKTGQKNFLTNNMRKGYGNTSVGHLFGQYGYQGEPFDNPRDMDRQERLLHKAKIGDPFKGNLKPSDTFDHNFKVYGGDKEPYKQQELVGGCRGKGGKWTYNNPNKKGYNGTFTAYPKYIQEGEKDKQRHSDEDGYWKPNFNGTSKGLGQTLARPCPPASHMVLNEIRRKA